MSLVSESRNIHKSIVILSSKEDENHAFLNTEEGFKKRCEILQNADFNVEHVSNCEEFPQFAQHLEKLHPNGVFQQIWRGHGNEKCFVLSKKTYGIASIDSDESLVQSIRTICRSIQKGGYLITESCCNGKWSDNFLKYLASFCQPGVVLIGSRNDRFDVQFEPKIPSYCRYYSEEGNDQTRIYYTSENTKIQNIDPQQMDLLWQFLGSSDETFELCYKLIGESQNLPEYRKIYDENRELITSHLLSPKDIKKQLLNVVVSSNNLPGFWEDMIYFVKQELRYSLDEHITIPINIRSSELIINEEGDIHTNNERQSCAIEVCYFLLGIAVLQKYKTVFQLIEHQNEPNSFSFLTECIYALSGLSFHINGSIPIFQQLNTAIQTVKNSYLLACDYNLFDNWLKILLWHSGSCVNANITALNEFYENLLLNPPSEVLNEKQEEARFSEDEITKADQIKKAIVEDCRKFLEETDIEFLAQSSIFDYSSLSDYLQKIIDGGILDPSDLLMIAIQAQFIPMIEVLNEKAVDINLPDRNGSLPIFKACQTRNIKVLSYLLELGADPNSKSEHGETPLHFLTEKGEHELMKLLMSFGANPRLPSESGYTPYDYAQLYDDWEAGEILRGIFEVEPTP